MTTSKMNFYTQNGWAGSNYDSKLQTKDVAAKDSICGYTLLVYLNAR